MVRPIEPQKLDQPTEDTVLSSSLEGFRILVVEDDYYLAMEAKTVLEDAGARILGPVSGIQQFQSILAHERPDCAVVDINLGDGPSFEVAKLLEAEGVPFLFLTGYSSEAVPAEFRHVPQTRKPAQTEHLLRAVRGLVR